MKHRLKPVQLRRQYTYVDNTFNYDDSYLGRQNYGVKLTKAYRTFLNFDT